MRPFFAVTFCATALMACSQDSSLSGEAVQVNDTAQVATSLVVDQTAELDQESGTDQIVKPAELVKLEDIWDLAASRPGADIGQVFQLFRLKQSLGPRNVPCFDPKSEDVCAKIVEAISIVGLTEQQVGLLLDSLELPHRAIQRDCELLPVTEDFVAGRVNLAVADGVVTGWGSEGSEEFHYEGAC